MAKEYHPLVRITQNDDGPVERPVWCLVVSPCGDPETFCSSEYYMDTHTEGNHRYEEGSTRSNKIDCPKCIAAIKNIKSVII